MEILNPTKVKSRRILIALILTLSLVFLLFLPAYAIDEATTSISVNQSDGTCVTGSGQVDPYIVVYCFIQDAIDDASAGDTISVASGTYVEDLEIPVGTDNIDLVGAGLTTTIKGVSNVAAASFPLAVPNIEVLADGVTIRNFTIQGPDPDT